VPEIPQGVPVLERALDRIRSVYEKGSRVVVAFSGGKDSTVVLQLCLIVAKEYDALPVEATFFDEEVIYPGTTDYIERVYERSDVNLHWLATEAPRSNAFSREHPYWWTFDSRLEPEEWVRQPPAYTEWVEDADMRAATKVERFPPPEGKDLVVMLGIRATESRNRRMSVFSTKGFISKVNKFGHKTARPIFDWKDGDVWRAISTMGWDYATTYNTMYRLGIPKSRLRVGPPTMTVAAVGKLRMSAKAWPRWFDAICIRIPGIRTAAQFGKKSVTPQRRLHETWKECFQRVCIDDAPTWIAERSVKYRILRLRQHSYHASDGDLPDANDCNTCYCNGSWKTMCKALFMGDPLGIRDASMGYVQPGQFREGMGNWVNKKKKTHGEED